MTTSGHASSKLILVILRTRHFACFFLLLSSLTAAQASVPGASASRGYNSYVVALLSRHAVEHRADHAPEALLDPHLATAASFELPARSRAAVRIAWTQRPPASHSAAIFAATGFARTTRL